MADGNRSWLLMSFWVTQAEAHGEDRLSLGPGGTNLPFTSQGWTYYYQTIIGTDRTSTSQRSLVSAEASV